METNENTPLKQKYDKTTGTDYELKAAVFPIKVQTKENKENNISEKNKRVDVQEKEIKGAKIKKQKKIKSIERSIEEKENSLNISKTFLKKSSSTKNSKNKSYLGQSKQSSRNNSPNPFQNQNNNVPEVVQLNRKIMALRKSLDEERNALMKEKQKNRELNEEIERLNRKVKKLEIKNEKSSQLESDYVKLMESFEKSEAIRKQQKLLISNLKKESGKIVKKK